LNGCYVACGCGTGYRCGALLDGWRLQYIRHVRSCRERGQRATRAGQRAARSEVQKHKSTTANAPRMARSSSASNFRVAAFNFRVVRLGWKIHLNLPFRIHARAPTAYPASRVKLPHRISCVSPFLPAPFLPLAPSHQAASSRGIVHMQAGQCGNQMGTEF
jgi:hypothetical protein